MVSTAGICSLYHLGCQKGSLIRPLSSLFIEIPLLFAQDARLSYYSDGQLQCTDRTSGQDSRAPRMAHKNRLHAIFTNSPGVIRKTSSEAVLRGLYKKGGQKTIPDLFGTRTGTKKENPAVDTTGFVGYSKYRLSECCRKQRNNHTKHQNACNNGSNKLLCFFTEHVQSTSFP